MEIIIVSTDQATALQESLAAYLATMAEMIESGVLPLQQAVSILRDTAEIIVKY